MWKQHGVVNNYGFASLAPIMQNLHNCPHKYWENYLNSSDQTGVNQMETMAAEGNTVSTWERLWWLGRMAETAIGFELGASETFSVSLGLIY